ncbi:MAG TPA: DUF1957 domain-containing protein [Candidatus Ornithospirochaeta avicola]|uniref:DUF1957 domain-containing protein n=1 Tax=Candidatus Ornithospirochaeta avicola TaxID=2840896 RepID=A0A9D1PRC3_9SPIO|nr:DUF1957 domain-containing protein [Candidatus Ornithospirochaeta avicola]
MSRYHVNFILHAHLPYVRHIDYPRFLEEDWLYESLNESYIPLFRKLDRLEKDNVSFHLTICFSPTLLTMLEDEKLKERFKNYMDLHIDLGRKEVERLSADEEKLLLARKYLKDLEENWAFYAENNLSLIPLIKRMRDNGHIELMTTAATHAYLPLYREYETAVRAQIELGISTFRRIFGFDADGFWLPECGYYPGLDSILSQYGIKYCQLPSHSVISSRDKSIGAGYMPVTMPSGLNGFVRDWQITSLIWSDKSGYPADEDYREFYRDIGYDLPLSYIAPYIHEPEVRVFTGFKYYAITGKNDEKRVYNLDKVKNKVLLHVNNYIYHIKRKALAINALGIDEPVFNLCYDAELFGHRWYEGLDFLEEFLRRISEDEQADLTLPSSVLSDNTIRKESLFINDCSWGLGGYSDVWLDGSNRWIYRHIHEAIERMEELTRRFPDQGTLKKRFLNQASREVLLAMSSDWAYIMHDNTSVTYAEKRLRNHLGSFNVVYSSMCKNSVNTEWLIKAEKRNLIFPEIDYRVFKKN